MDLLNVNFVTAVLAAIIAIDTALSYIPSIKANSTFQMIDNLIRKIFSFVSGK